MTFGHKLKKLREDRGISQKKLARRLGYKTNSYVSDMEKGKFVPSQKKVKQIAKTLTVPSSRLKGLLIKERLKELDIVDRQGKRDITGLVLSIHPQQF